VLALIDGMSQLAKALDSLQGRKQVIFLSSGFDPKSLVGEEGAQAVRDSEAVVTGRIWEVQTENRFGDTQVRQQLREMLRSFSSSDAVVHTVDLAGLSARGDARHQVAEPARRSGQESLAEIANLSGGRLFKDTNDLGLALREILELSRRYYVLAFEAPETRGPGRFHKLKVRVKDKGRSVSHRAGYYERQPYAQRTPMARMFEAAEVITKGAERAEFDVRALAVPYRGPAGRVTLPVALQIEGSRLLDRGPGDTLPLEIYGYALDEAGTVEDVVGMVSNLTLEKVSARLRDRGLQCHATFTLSPGKHSLRFLVRDADTGRSGSHWLDVTIPAFDAKGVMLYPPLFMDDPRRWLILEALSRGTTAPMSP
ncbi:MAG: VWA domain-containing protein, partial [Gemmatimonadales bacterium]